ncbi:flagellar biosynthetic protein FliO [Marinobacterium ramblicola]|uniref:flagellar biosynthetic protein FliO n=1 Tax=Marinobacterium ramblicola TaxID=2849041 RepID=UPI001FEB2410|nr:flagellar biosynthetic protein FliO [Marinobacterium ramblicola]
MLIAALPLVAGAAETASSAVKMSDPIGAGAVFELVLGLVAVIALILLLAWVVKRINVLPGQRSGMQVVAVLPLGQRERAVLVQVGEQQLLLGVGASQVTLLERFDTPVIEPGRAPEGAFAKRLQDVMRQRGSIAAPRSESDA